MSTSVAESSSVSSTDSRSGDVFLAGVVAMLCVNVVQRLVGIVRNFGFCKFLSEEQLGSWALANSFFLIVVPISLLGLTGGFGRYIEHYRCQGKLGNYVWGVLKVSAIGVALTIGAMLMWSDGFSWLVFNGSEPMSVTIWCAITLLSLVVFSVVYELVGGLRQVRLMGVMQFLQSTVFAIVGLPLIAKFGSWVVLLPSFSVACLVAAVPGVWRLVREYRTDFTAAESFDSHSMWRRILPYAVSLWLLNLLGNLFEVSDRYMLLHLSGSVEIGQAAVGEYHCGRIIPNLLVSVALMLSGVVLPFVSRDWEAGDRQAVANRLRQMLISMSIGFTGLGIAALAVAPTLFYFAFGDRYSQALGILPIALAHATWVGLFLIVQNYLLCIEKMRSLLFLCALGLVINLALNAVMISYWGLPGAMIATTTASLLSLLLLRKLVAESGCDLGASSLVVMMVPISLIGGPILAAAVIVALVFIAGRTNYLLSQQDRQDIDAAILPKLEKLGLRLTTIWP